MLLSDASTAMANRWREATTVEAMLAELWEHEFNKEPVAHPEVTTAIGEMRSLLLELGDASRSLGLPGEEATTTESAPDIEVVDEALDV